MKTPWTDKVLHQVAQGEQPLNEYPRPQLVRGNWTNLNGLWQYAITDITGALKSPAGSVMHEAPVKPKRFTLPVASAKPKKGAYTPAPEDITPPTSYDGTILVPFALESRLSGAARPLLPTDVLWYRREFQLAASASASGALPTDNKRYILHFGAVDWECTVWVNGIEVARNRGGYLPFSCDITNALLAPSLRGASPQASPTEQSTENHEIVVMVQDPTDTFWQQKGKQTLTPHSCFYTASSGMWQTVWIEEVPSSYITGLTITPDIDTNTVTIEPKVDIATGYMSRDKDIVIADSADYKVRASVYDGDTLVAQEAVGSTGTTALSLHIDNPILWSPDNPHLYDVKVELFTESAEADADNLPIDTVTSYFGMRKFHMIKDEQGIPRFALNNKILFLHGPLDQGYYPDGIYTAPTEEALKFDIEEMKSLGFNMVRKHIKVEPLRWYYWCDKLGMVVIQDMINGGDGGTAWWQYVKQYLFKDMRGDDTTKGSYKRNYRPEESRKQFEEELYQMVDHLHNITSIGIWVPFNECWGQFDAARITEELKAYDPTRLIDHASGWLDQGVSDFYSFHRYNKPLYLPKHIQGRGLFLSEYGGYTLSLPEHLWTDKVFGYGAKDSKAELDEAYTKLIEEQLLPLKAQGCCAAVYTQWTDVEKEINGFYTYDRKVLKISAEVVKRLNRKLSTA